MSGFICAFDATGSDCYVKKTVPAAPLHLLDVDVAFPQATWDAFQASHDTSADLIVVGNPASTEDGLYSHPDVPDWATDGGGIGASPPPVPVTVAHVTLIASYHGSGNDWDMTWLVNGVAMVATYVATLNVDDTLPFDFYFGGIFSTGGSTNPEVYQLGNITIGDGVGYSFTADFASGVFDPSIWDAVVGSPVVVAAPPTPPSPFPAPSGGFFVGYPWRFIITDLDSVTTTFAEGLLTNRTISIILDDASVITFDVWPDDFRINGLWTDGYPRLAQSNRLDYAFRREAPIGGDPWVCRAAGIVMSPEDEGDVDVPVSHISAWDAWRYCDARPVMAMDGSLPSETNGFQFLPPAFPSGDQIALTLLAATIANEGTVHIDAGVAWGGTAFYAGTLETTGAINFTAQRGDSVGDAWRNLCQVGNMDIVLTPIYDPENRPGYTHEMNIYNIAGDDKHAAVFGWDMMNHAVAHMSRMHDGSPGQFFNKVQYFAGQAGFQLPLQVNASSVTDFGSWWSQQFFPGQTDTDPTGAATLALAKQALVLAKQGKRTVTLNPIPERSPLLFDKYGIGDRVPVYASDRLRVISNGLQRVSGIPIQIDDNGIEHIGGLLCSPDYRTP